MNNVKLLESQVQSLLKTAVEKQRSGKLDEAECLYRNVVQMPEGCWENRYKTIAITNLGNVLQQQGKLEEAIASYQQALRINPEYPEAHNNLGNVLRQQGKLEEAIASYQQALTIKPDFALAHNNLGNALKQQGKLEAAIASYQQALTVKPDYADAYNNLGNTLYDRGKLEAAIESYQQALRIKPDYAEAHNNLGNTLKERGKLELAIESYQQALKLKPDFVEAYNNLGSVFKLQGNLEAAIECYQKALNIQPDNALARLGMLTSQLPIIYANVEEVQSSRERYQQYLHQLADYYQNVEAKERAKAAEAVGATQPFFLAYQGFNDRQLQATYGEAIAQLMASRYPQFSQPIPLAALAENEKIRVGFVSGFFCNHSNWKIPIKGWVENLDRNHFELFGYYTNSQPDRETAIAAQSFAKFIQGTLPIEKWCDTIKQDNLHVLIFPEFGMDPTTVQLGCLRLAPIQMTSWGHPQTSGLPTIDYFLSSDLMEGEKAIDCYTEKLVRLPNLSIYYTQLEIQPQAIYKPEIGLEQDELMFWCCQSLYKYLPQHDDVFPRIAQQLPQSKFVFISNDSAQLTQVFRQRLSRAFAEFGLNYLDHCLWLPRLENQRFQGVAAIADVFLDSIGWSGCNSTLESVAYNLPVVTLPGELMRASHSTAILKMMGITEGIAASKDDYVQLAVRLGKDEKYRQFVSQEIAQNKHKLYRDLQPIEALENFLMNIVKDAPTQRQSPNRVTVATVSEILQTAVKYLREGRLAAAEQVYNQILQIQPNHPEALYGLGVVGQQLGQLEKAEKYLKDLLNLHPGSFKGWFSLGNLRQAQGEWKQAEDAYQKALAIMPSLAALHNNLGYTLQQQGKWDEAIASYQKALELQPNCGEAEANLGNAFHAQGQVSKEQLSHYGMLNYQLGKERQKAGDYKTAIAYFRQAIAMELDLWEVHYNLGVALQAEGEFVEASACYQKALQLNPNCSETFFNLAKIYQSQKLFSEAASAYRQWLSIINPLYAKAIATYSNYTPIDDCTTPPISPGEVIVRGHSFPAIPSVSTPEKKQPFWSAIIPIYNRIDYLLECLASVLAQWSGEDEMEILVVDNASTTPVFEMVNSIGKGIVRYYRNPENIGAARNFNMGIALSRGQWVHLLPDDEYVLPGFYSRLKQSLESCPNSVGAAFTGYENIDEKEKVVFSQEVYGDRQGIAVDFVEKIGVFNPLNPSAVVIRREAHEKLGGYHPELNHTFDWELYKRIVSVYDWWYEPGILARYRQHSNNISTELFLTGAQATSIRRAIEISAGYLPAERCEEITAKSRRYYFNSCLKLVAIPLKKGSISGAFNLLQETLKIDRSPEALAKLFEWLSKDEFAPLRDKIAAKLLSDELPHESSTVDS